MLHIIKSIDHPYVQYIKDDPVRKELPLSFRISENKMMFALSSSNVPDSMVCVSFNDNIPYDIDDLKSNNNPTIAIFYTIWSYKSGAGRELLFETVKNIKENYSNIKRFVTLSPKTEMAKKFHLKNGAIIFRENENSVNYEYIL